MTVHPQEYKLNCTKNGHGSYGISMSIGSTALADYNNCVDENSNSPCPGTVLVSSTNIVRYTVDITWDGMTVSSGSISQSTTGDQMYQCVLDNPSGGDDRTRTLTIEGNVYKYICTCNYTKNNCVFNSTSNCSLFSY